MVKKCFKCCKEKELSEFYKHKQMADGHLGKCKECTKKDVSGHRKKNIEKIRAYDRKRGKLPHRLKLNKENSKKFRKKYPLVVKEQTRQYREAHPVRYAATMLLNNAVRGGKIKKPKKCPVCGKKKRIHGHHEDYYKPLDVVWVCQVCHKGLHKWIS